MLWPTNQTAAIELLTAAGEKRGNALVADWMQLYLRLFMLFRDGATPSAPEEGVTVKEGYAQDWYDRVAKATGTRYLVPAASEESERVAELNARKMKVLRKGT